MNRFIQYWFNPLKMAFVKMVSYIGKAQQI